MKTQLLDEEINRIKLLFGESLLYGNLNNIELIVEQVGRFFKKAWDDFKISKPMMAKNFDDISIKRFTDTDIKSLDDVFKHIDDNVAIWKAIGMTDNEIARVRIFKKKIMNENMPHILFSETSTPGTYFFDLIPTEGGLRGEVFYWFSKKYPDEWLKGLQNVQKNLELKNKFDNVKDAEGKVVDVEVKPNLPEVLPKVRVDSNGFPIDFKNGKAVDVSGNEVKLLDDGKPDTGLVKVEKTVTTDLAPIRVDDSGNPVDFNSNNRPIDTDGDEINVGGDGRPVDPDRPRVDEEYNPIDSLGNPLDEAGKVRRDQRLQFSTLEIIYETYIVRWWPGKAKFWERIIDIIKGVDLETKIINDFNETLETLLRQELDDVNSGLGIVALRKRVIDKFLELQKLKQSQLSGEFLQKIKDRVKDIEMEGFKPGTLDYETRLRDLNKLWSNLENQEDGLGALFNLMSKDKSMVDAFDVRVFKEWKDFWLTDILSEKLKNTDKAAWRVYTSHIVTTLFKRLWNIFLLQSPYSRVELQRILLRYGASPNAILYRHVVHLIASRVLQPILWSLAVYLFWGDNRPFGGIRRILEDKTGLEFTEGGEIDLWEEYMKPALLKPLGLGEEDQSIINTLLSITPTWLDDTFKWILTTLKDSEKTKEKLQKNIPIKGVENLKYKKQILEAEYAREASCLDIKNDLQSLDGWTYVKLENDSLEEAAKKLSSLLRIPMAKSQVIDTKAKLDSNVREIRPTFYIDGVGQLYVTKALDQNVYYVEKEDGSSKTAMLDFLKLYKDKIINQPTLPERDKTKEEIEQEKLKNVKDLEQQIKNKTGLGENFYKRIKKIIMENSGKKFGEDNFKHWNDTFIFKTEDKKNPGQYKEVKISMEDVMDRIDHYRKKYDEDDAFVRAVVDTHEDVVKIMYTKGLADIHESFTPRGLALVLRTLNESRGEMEIFSVARPANGNWFLVKGDFTQSQLANMDLEKKEPEDKKKEKEVSGSEELKKKEETAINILTTNEKKGLDGLPKKVRQKVLEKMGKGWTTEILPEFLKDIATKSEINTIFNDKIEIYKLEPNRKTFDSIVDNSSRIFIKRGFCRSLYLAVDNADLTEKQENVIDHILDKCDTKFAGKLGVRNF